MTEPDHVFDRRNDSVDSERTGSISGIDRVEIKEDLLHRMRLEVESQTWKSLPWKLTLAACVAAVVSGLTTGVSIWSFGLTTKNYIHEAIDERIPAGTVERIQKIEEKAERAEAKIEVIEKPAFSPIFP